MLILIHWLFGHRVWKWAAWIALIFGLTMLVLAIANSGAH